MKITSQPKCSVCENTTMVFILALIGAGVWTITWGGLNLITWIDAVNETVSHSDQLRADISTVRSNISDIQQQINNLPPHEFQGTGSNIGVWGIATTSASTVDMFVPPLKGWRCDKYSTGIFNCFQDTDDPKRLTVNCHGNGGCV